MKRITLVLASVVAVTVPNPVAFGGQDCATHDEYLHIHEGMWRHRVTLIFGFIGDPATHHDGVTTRRYGGCKLDEAAIVDFRHRRVVDKAWTRNE